MSFWDFCDKHAEGMGELAAGALLVIAFVGKDIVRRYYSFRS